jgi:hypothetical protein
MQHGARDQAGADLDRLVRRLRGLSARAWQAAGRRAAVFRLLEQLAAITAPGHTLPELPDYALADAVAVLGHDALADPEHAEGAAHLLRDALDHTK